jgi:transposase
MQYIGCDFHPSFQVIAQLDKETGELVRRRLAHGEGQSEVQQFYQALPGSWVVGVEATRSTYWFERLLKKLGHQMWMGDATKIRQQDGRKQKHDKRDARLILRLLLEERFPRIWIPSVEERDLRQLLLHRWHLVRMRSRIKSQLQHIALNQGLQKKSKLWTKAGLEQLRKLELEPWARQRRDELLEMLEQMGEWIEPLDQAVEQAAAAQPRTSRL